MQIQPSKLIAEAVCVEMHISLCTYTDMPAKPTRNLIRNLQNTNGVLSICRQTNTTHVSLIMYFGVVNQMGLCEI